MTESQIFIGLFIVLMIWLGMRKLLKLSKEADLEDELNESAIKEKSNDKDNQKKETTFMVDDIPDGYEVYEESSFFVQGVTHRFKACLEWAQGEGHQISFKREPNNKHDENAIAIFGKSSTGRRKLGYIAAEIADDLVYRELDNKLKAKLIGVEIKEAPFIEFEILVLSAAYEASG